MPTSKEIEALRAGRTTRPRSGDPIARLRHQRLEKEVLAAVLAYLKTVPGIVYWRQNVGAAQLPSGDRMQTVRFGFPGLSDIQGFTSTGRAFFIETKRAGKEPTDLQRIFLDLARSCRCIAFVARSVEDVRVGLAANGVKCP